MWGGLQGVETVAGLTWTKQGPWGTPVTAEKAGGRGHYGEGCRDLHSTAADWMLQSHSQVSESCQK